MTNKTHQTGRTGGKTKTSTLNQWAKSTINPVMGCKVKRLDRPKTRERKRNKPQAQARGGGIKWQESCAVSSSDSFFFSKEVNQ